MKTHRKLIVTAVAVGAALLALAGVQAAGVLQAQPTAVAVVDLGKLFEQLKEKAQLDAELSTAQANVQQEAEAKKKQAQLLQSDLDVLQPGTENYRQKQEELGKAAIEFKVWGQFEQAKLQRMAGLRIENLYTKALSAVDRIAQESGYDLVLAKEAAPKFQYENLQQLLQQLGFRKTLYASDAIDITDQVIQRMNNEFDAAR